MKKLLLIFITCNISSLYGVGFQDFKIQQAELTRSRSISPSAGQSSNANCPICPSSSTTSIPWPQFNIAFGTVNSSNQFIPDTTKTFIFPTDSGFTYSSALLIIHIFPPSNIISASTVTSAATESSYVVMSTLKSLDGSMLQKKYQSFPAGSIPTSIQISSITQAQTTTTTPTTTLPINQNPQVTPLVANAFLSSISSLSSTAQQQIFNGISPFSQKFLIIQDTSGNLTATPISGMFETEESSSATALVSKPSPTGIATIQPISVSINDTLISSDATNSSTFEQKTLPFSKQDLQNGLTLNVHVFPPSTTSTTSGTYTLIATLRTLDGLKLRKKVMQNVSLSSIPYQISINYGSNPIFSTTFLNQTATAQIINISAPINLRCLLQQDAKGNITVGMM